ncbi:Sucrose transport protein SUC4 [Sesamum angolense]|uniref:Sucrose transport protein SUC4 n=1 Tax=Sesamum angolense TaxID=2727404 RepID=A0AAE2BJH9_9LAMI|nr:Sucrose transport protein SUC4 [Sesamum angolense]
MSQGSSNHEAFLWNFLELLDILTVYGGKPNEGTNYGTGVRMGSLGLMLNSVILGITSVLMEKLPKMGCWFYMGTFKYSNVSLLCGNARYAAIRMNLNTDGHLPPDGVVIAALVFALLGIPLAITYSVPYALVSTRIEALGLGQGLSMGVLNLAIVIPQIIVSLGAGPWDQLFGGGNSPALLIAAISAFASALIAILAIPRTRVEKTPRSIVQVPVCVELIVTFRTSFEMVDIDVFVIYVMLGKDHRRTRVSNAYFSLFMAVCNVLGFATGSYSNWFKIFPFTLTSACNVSCANLKAAFIIDIIFILLTRFISLPATHEQHLISRFTAPYFGEVSEGSSNHEAFLWELFGPFRYLPGAVWIILLVTVLAWIGWFPFLLVDTDWMGREVYGGKPNEGMNYGIGVRIFSLGLMLNSVILGITSVLREKLCRKWGAGFTWGLSNILTSLCFVAMLAIIAIKMNMNTDGHLPPDGVVIAALVVFALLDIPLAEITLGLGQGLSMGVLNLAIVIPQTFGSTIWLATHQAYLLQQFLLLLGAYSHLGYSLNKDCKIQDPSLRYLWLLSISTTVELNEWANTVTLSREEYEQLLHRPVANSVNIRLFRTDNALEFVQKVISDFWSLGVCVLSISIPLILINFLLALSNVYFWDIHGHRRGYRCYDPQSHRSFTSVDVTFFESTPFYSPQFSQAISPTLVPLPVPTLSIPPCIQNHLPALQVYSCRNRSTTTTLTASPGLPPTAAPGNPSATSANDLPITLRKGKGPTLLIP